MLKRMISVVLCLVLALSLCGCEKLDYQKAVELYEAGGYEGAKAAFEALGEYEDSAEYAAKAQLIIDYRNAIELYASENYEEAAALFETLGEYEKSGEYLKKIEVRLAEQEEKLLAEKIVGRWETEEVDMTDMFKGVFMEQMAALGYEGVEPEGVDKVTLIQWYSFEEYGVVRVGFTEDSFAAFLASLAEIMKSTMLSVTEQELIAVAEENAVTFDDLLIALEVSSVQEYLEFALGMSLDELFEAIFGGDILSAESTEVSGVWFIRDGKLNAIVGEEHEEAEYDMEKDTITMLSNSMEEYNYLYPYSLTRADGAKPAA